VEATDSHLVLAPSAWVRQRFSGGSRARILSDRCTACGECLSVCRFEAIELDGADHGRLEGTYRVDPIVCEGCGLCAYVCDVGAVELTPVVNGEWYISHTRVGPMAHARLYPGEENSGKLVTRVRSEACRIAECLRRDLILIDGPPGIGCSVIASVTGVDLVLIVTEPTPSGRHDALRVIELTEHFRIPACLSVNKWNLNEEVAEQIEAEAVARGVRVLNRVRYDPAVSEAQINLWTVVEHTKDGAAADIRRLWKSVSALLVEPSRTAKVQRRAANG